MTRPSRSATGQLFQSTQWSIVASAAEGSDDALAALCTDYWQPLYAHVRRMGYAESDAQDLTQSFFSRVIEKRLVSCADSRRGRFRTFLLTALKRFVINEWKRGRTARAGGGNGVLSLEFTDVDGGVTFEPAHSMTPEAQFDRQWAIRILEHAVTRLQQQQQHNGNGPLFDRLVSWLTMEGEPPGYQAIADEFDLTVSALKMTVKRWREELARFVREEIRKTVATDEDVDAEFRILREALNP